MDYSEWVFHDIHPIYLQLIGKLKSAIYSGLLQPGTRIPSVRRMASILRINPNTVSRSYKQLKKEKLFAVTKSNCHFVTPNAQYIAKKRESEAHEFSCSFLCSMLAYGFSKDEASKFFLEYVSTLNFPAKGGCLQHE